MDHSRRSIVYSGTQVPHPGHGFFKISLKPECMKEEIMKEDMTTLSSVLEQLRLKQEDHEFRWTEQGFTAGKGKIYQPEDLKIIRTYRFEGESDPSDSSILYVIEANDQLVGYSLDA